MNQSVLLIGDGPFANYMAKRFQKKGFSIIMTTIEEAHTSIIRSNGYIPIYASNLHEDGCEKIYNQCITILNDYSLTLKYIVHTARSSFYEYFLKPNQNNSFDELEDREPPDESKREMFDVNSKSPEILARYFFSLGCQFIYISSCATKAFPRSLAHPASEKKNGKKIGTHAVKYYSYTKRLGEEFLYNFYKKKNSLSLLSIAYISIMFGTKFYTDMGIPDPHFLTGFASCEKNANYIVDGILKNRRRIHVFWQSKAMSIVPRFVNFFVLDSQEWLK